MVPGKRLKSNLSRNTSAHIDREVPSISSEFEKLIRRQDNSELFEILADWNNALESCVHYFD